jgi:hypothetical protein
MGLKLSRNSRTPENDHLHIHSPWTDRAYAVHTRASDKYLGLFRFFGPGGGGMLCYQLDRLMVSIRVM